MRVFTLFFFCISLMAVSCGNKTKEENMYQKPTEVKEGMLFSIFYKHNNCSYEILVNDMPIITHFASYERSGLTVDINQYILQPGTQEVTIRMYPPKLANNTFAPSLMKDSYVRVILKKDKRSNDEDWAWSEEAQNLPVITLIDYKTPEITEDNIPYKEYKFNFEVLPEEMTWHITGWSNSQDLRQDPNIRAEVDAFYNEFRAVLEKGDGEQYMSLLKKTITEDAGSRPWADEAEFYLTKNMKEYAGQKRVFGYTCTTPELKFYGNGRVVTLICRDTAVFGYSALLSAAEKSSGVSAHTFYLHKPIGSNKLEIIR